MTTKLKFYSREALHDGNQVAKTRQALAEDLKKQWEATQ